jgi:hypothetical protein
MPGGQDFPPLFGQMSVIFNAPGIVGAVSLVAYTLKQQLSLLHLELSAMKSSSIDA